MKLSETYCRTVWVIDDEEVSHFVNTNILRINNFSSNVKSFFNAQEALAELKISEGLEKFPDFIFLDLSMPAFGGLDFLHAYSKFPKEIKEKCTLYILSSSLHEDDKRRSLIYEEVRDFFSKPLTKLNLEVVKFQSQFSSYD